MGTGLLYTRYSARARSLLAPALRRTPGVKRALLKAAEVVDGGKHLLGVAAPTIIRPRTRHLSVAVTAACNLSCAGCRYGREFMKGERLTTEDLVRIVDAASAMGIWDIRLYGGEPLLHGGLQRVVRQAIQRGLNPWLNTNGRLLDSRFDDLFDAGLRTVSIGLYGTGDEYDRYVGRTGAFEQLERSLSILRSRHGSGVDVSLNYLLTRLSCTEEAVDRAYHFAGRFGAHLRFDLVHDSLPYFTEGPNRILRFRDEDRSALNAVVDRLLDIRREAPEIYAESPRSIRSIPDWIFGDARRSLPCDRYDDIWIAADGSVQLCYAAFPLGNVRERPLQDILYTAVHRQAARDAFALRCPTCYCERESRVNKWLIRRWPRNGQKSVRNDDYDVAAHLLR